jgi:hypothetical protein
VIFLPGIIAPASARYAVLLQHLPGVRAVVKDLEVYAGDAPPADYSITQPTGRRPPWMAKRPAGIRVFRTAIREHRVMPDAYRGFDRPVLFTHGSLSHPRWLTIRDRLSGLFPQWPERNRVDRPPSMTGWIHNPPKGEQGAAFCTR